MNRKRKAQKQAADYAGTYHHELGPWRDTTRERCYTYCSRCGGILTIHVEDWEKYIFEKTAPAPDDPKPTVSARWNNGVRVQEYICPTGQAMASRVVRQKERKLGEPRD